jgi:25S rRNA (adenine(2142)-N(1))-methyltransferase, Bmt2
VGTADSSAVVEQPADAQSSAKIVALPAASFDAAVLSLVLSYMPLPSQRAAMVAKARQLLKCPVANADTSEFCANLDGAARLIIIEPYSTAAGGRRLSDLPRLQRWCEAIETMGFKLEEYEFLQRSHVLSFSTVPLPAAAAAASCTSSSRDGSADSSSSSDSSTTDVPLLDIAFDDHRVFDMYQSGSRVGGRRPVAQ